VSGDLSKNCGGGVGGVELVHEAPGLHYY